MHFQREQIQKGYGNVDTIYLCNVKKNFNEPEISYISYLAWHKMNQEKFWLFIATFKRDVLLKHVLIFSYTVSVSAYYSQM